MVIGISPTVLSYFLGIISGYAIAAILIYLGIIAEHYKKQNQD